MPSRMVAEGSGQPTVAPSDSAPTPQSVTTSLPIDDAFTAKTRAVPNIEWRNRVSKDAITGATKRIPAERRPEVEYIQLEKRVSAINDYIDLNILPCQPFYDSDDVSRIKADLGDFACGEVDKDASDAFFICKEYSLSAGCDFKICM